MVAEVELRKIDGEFPPEFFKQLGSIVTVKSQVSEQSSLQTQVASTNSDFVRKEIDYSCLKFHFLTIASYSFNHTRISPTSRLPHTQ